MQSEPDDLQWMQLALEWAAKGLWTTTPNPRVGCALVKDNQLIAAGYTQPAGQAHAEIDALRRAAETGHDVKGATAYITLEPCSHYGRTPPCTDALIRADIKRVVAAVKDPNPLVAGRGLTALRVAGIDVSCGLLEREARELNIGFFSRMQRGRPWIRLKIAASLDGKTALPNGQSQWITSSASREDGHQWRARACAILTGIGTVKVDNPQLTVRALPALSPFTTPPRQPQRIVVDSRLDISLHAKILTGAPVWLATAQHNASKEALLRAQGVEVLFLPGIDHKVDLSALMEVLGERQINELHVEAGEKLNGALLRAGCVDELLIYLAPALLGAGASMFDLPVLQDLQQKYALSFHQVTQVGSDVCILARFKTSSESPEKSGFSLKK